MIRRPSRCPNVNGFRGVSYLAKANLYVARLRIQDGEGKTFTKSLGCFLTALDAAKAYDQAVRDFKLVGERWINFPLPGEAIVHELLCGAPPTSARQQASKPNA